MGNNEIHIVRFRGFDGKPRLQVNGLGGMPLCPDCEDTPDNRARMQSLADRNKRSAGAPYSPARGEWLAEIKFVDRCVDSVL